MSDMILNAGDIIKELEKYPKDRKVKLSVMGEFQIEVAKKKISNTFFQKGSSYDISTYKDDDGDMYIVISGS